jgi:glucokinase
VGREKHEITTPAGDVVGTATRLALVSAQTGPRKLPNRNLELKVVATGEVYLSAGMPPRLLLQLQNRAFMRAFNANGCSADLLRAVPVYVNLLDTSLLGFGLYALRHQVS